MKTALIAMVLLAGCGGVEGAVCYSPCGVPLLGSADCTGFDAAEGRALEALAEVPEMQGRDLCAEVASIHSVTIAAPDSLDEKGRFLQKGVWVFGNIDCAPLQPDRIKLAWWLSLTHEYTHHLLACAPDHDDWSVRGFYRAANKSNLEFLR